MAVPAIPAAISPAAVTQTSTRTRAVIAEPTSAAGRPTRTVAPCGSVTASTRLAPSPGRSTVRAFSPAERSAAASAPLWAAVIGCPLSSEPGPGVVVLATTTRDSLTEPSSSTAPKAPTGSPRESTKANGSRFFGIPPPGIGPPPGGFAARMATVCSWSSSLPYM